MIASFHLCNLIFTEIEDVVHAGSTSRCRNVRIPPESTGIRWNGTGIHRNDLIPAGMEYIE